jgi:hypothetical protein
MSELRARRKVDTGFDAPPSSPDRQEPNYLTWSEISTPRKIVATIVILIFFFTILKQLGVFSIPVVLAVDLDVGVGLMTEDSSLPVQIFFFFLSLTNAFFFLSFFHECSFLCLDIFSLLSLSLASILSIATNSYHLSIPDILCNRNYPLQAGRITWNKEMGSRMWQVRAGFPGLFSDIQVCKNRHR